MHWTEVANELDPALRRGDLAYCSARVAEVLRGLSESPFHLVLAVDFTNDPATIAAHFDEFVGGLPAGTPLAAVYTETNGFYINPDRWYFEIFGCPTYGSHDDYDWLAEYSATYPLSITLTGMEPLQQAYQDVRDSQVYDVLSHGGDPEAERLQTANGIADLLVVLRFQALIQRSAVHMRRVRVPVLATAHDYDFIAEFMPARPSNE